MCQLKSVVEAQEARTAPPLGPLLAQFGLEMLKVCKELNEKTKNYEKGTPLPVKIEIDELKSYKIELGAPTITFLFNNLNEGVFTVLDFYDLVKIYSVYHEVEINKGMVKELLSSLSSMEIVKIDEKKS